VGYFVVIRGPLGVGKSTVAERLAKEIGGEHVAIDRILEENGLEEWDEDRISLKSFLRANAVAAERAQKPLENGVPVVFDGNFYWKEAIEDLLDRLPFPHWVITLEAPLSLCIERDRQRPRTQEGAEPRAGDSLGVEAATQVYHMVSQVRYGIAVDATGSVGATVTSILRQIRADGPGSEAP
jgi:predicted kinase